MRATVTAPSTMNTRTVAYSTSIVSSCPALGRKMATKPPPGAFYLRHAEGNGFMPRGCGLHTIDNTILGNSPKSTKKNHTGTADLRNSRSGCAASEGGAPFVARRAMNLHGCALPHCAPPPAATPPDPPHNSQASLTRCRRKPIMSYGPGIPVIAHPPRAGGVSPRGRGGAVGGRRRRLRRGAIPLPGRHGRGSPRRRSGRRSPPAGGRGRGSTPRSTPSRRSANSPPFWRPSIDSGTRGSTR